MPNLKPIFIAKFIIFLAAFVQSFNCQADISKLQKADSLFNTKNYQEAMTVYEDLLENDQSFSPAMLLKMAFISEGKGNYSKSTFYLTKYYDINPNPRVITKIKTLTSQSNLVGYTLSDRDRFFKFLTELQQEITSGLALLLVISLILLFIFKNKADKPKYYLPSFLLILMVFTANNFLEGTPTGIVTGSPTLIMDKPTAGGNLIRNVDPGHRVIIKSSKDVWYEILWGDQTAFVRKESISRL
jgi:tetratricopeptide (TPR) repeat protein